MGELVLLSPARAGQQALGCWVDIGLEHCRAVRGEGTGGKGVLHSCVQALK